MEGEDCRGCKLAVTDDKTSQSTGLDLNCKITHGPGPFGI